MDWKEGLEEEGIPGMSVLFPGWSWGSYGGRGGPLGGPGESKGVRFHQMKARAWGLGPMA